MILLKKSLLFVKAVRFDETKTELRILDWKNFCWMKKAWICDRPFSKYWMRLHFSLKKGNFRSDRKNEFFFYSIGFFYYFLVL